MKKLPWILAALFFLSSLFLVYFFLFKGKTVPAEDGRTAILMKPEHRNFALQEMRGFLESVAQIHDGILKEDREQIIHAARSSGGTVVDHAPAGLMARLPMAFKQMGFAVHGLFDEMADSLEAGSSLELTREQLNIQFNNCVACHKTFKIEPEQ